MSANPFLIRPAELESHLGRPGLGIVDASWYLPAQGRNARAEFEAGHVPGAVFFDQDAVVDPDSDLPHTLPAPTVFAKAVGAMGISQSDTIVVYDGMGLFSAPRVWWMFRAFGAKDVRILDGGLPAWLAAGFDLETEVPGRQSATFAAHFDADRVATFDAMKAIVAGTTAQIVDARPADRFAGTAPEPRPGVRAGHMPGAHSLPIASLAREGRLLPPDQLRAAFEAAGIDPKKPVVTSCGSGVTAAVVNFALASLGDTSSRLYDGSWTQWGSAPDTPVETGAAK